MPSLDQNNHVVAHARPWSRYFMSTSTDHEKDEDEDEDEEEAEEEEKKEKVNEEADTEGKTLLSLSM